MKKAQFSARWNNTRKRSPRLGRVRVWYANGGAYQSANVYNANARSLAAMIALLNIIKEGKKV